MAVIGIITAIGAPMFLSFQRAQEAEGAAQEVVTMLNRARQLAITRGTSFTMETEATAPFRSRFCSGVVASCPNPVDATVWRGEGTDGSGWFPRENGVSVVLRPVISFNTLGAAVASGTLRVQDSGGTACRDIVVNPSGRIQITASAACP
jgi:Tfp pilus assembly protein FimT